MGLNSRFDRMIEHINMASRPSKSVPTTYPCRRGPRARSAISPSLGGSNVPKTPVDPYDGLEEGRLGKTFSVLKMKSGNRYHKASDRNDRGSDVTTDDSTHVRISTNSIVPSSH